MKVTKLRGDGMGRHGEKGKARQVKKKVRQGTGGKVRKGKARDGRRGKEKVRQGTGSRKGRSGLSHIDVK